MAEHLVKRYENKKELKAALEKLIQSYLDAETNSAKKAQMTRIDKFIKINFARSNGNFIYVDKANAVRGSRIIAKEVEDILKAFSGEGTVTFNEFATQYKDQKAKNNPAARYYEWCFYHAFEDALKNLYEDQGVGHLFKTNSSFEAQGTYSGKDKAQIESTAKLAVEKFLEGDQYGALTDLGRIEIIPVAGSNKQGDIAIIDAKDKTPILNIELKYHDPGPTKFYEVSENVMRPGEKLLNYIYAKKLRSEEINAENAYPSIEQFINGLKVGNSADADTFRYFLQKCEVENLNPTPKVMITGKFHKRTESTVEVSRDLNEILEEFENAGITSQYAEEKFRGEDVYSKVFYSGGSKIGSIGTSIERINKAFSRYGQEFSSNYPGFEDPNNKISPIQFLYILQKEFYSPK